MLMGMFFISHFVFAQRYLPSAVPDRVILTWKDDPAHSQAVTWRTSIYASGSAAQIAVASATPDFPKSAITIPATDDFLNAEGLVALYHSVNFSGLQPSTKYAYRVGNDSAWSEWFHFTTASEKPGPFSFIYFGDAQNDLKSLWSRAIREAYTKAPGADFMIHAGDLVNRGRSDAEWGEWFYAGGWIYGMLPSLPVPGNHEYGKRSPEATTRELTPHWDKLFTLPENGPEGLERSVYYTDFQGTRFISLDTQAFFENEKAQKSQIDWLETVLKNNPMRWTVVVHHHPIYSPAFGRDNPELRAAFKPLYDKYGVDLVLQGHDHTYGRGGNETHGARVKAKSGPVYVVSVSGPKMYISGFEDWMDNAAVNLQLYQVVHISNDSLKYEAFTVTGELYDAFTLVKEKNRSNTFYDLTPAGMPIFGDLPPRYIQNMDTVEVKEYQTRFQQFKKRTGRE